MNILEYIKKGIVYFDGGTGTSLQAIGLMPGEFSEIWNFTNTDKIISLHKDYIKAGANIIKTNTFGANLLKFPEDGQYSYSDIIKKAIENAKEARIQSKEENVFIAYDIGPTGRLLKPLGDLDFEEAVELFAKQIRVAKECGVDLVLIETMNDSYETKAALLAVKENSDLPVFVTNAYDKTGKLMTGADPLAMIAMLEGLGADAIGVNCSVGPDMLGDIISVYNKYSSLPVIANPNAGLPTVVDGDTVYSFTSEKFCDEMLGLLEKGATIIGGCCGTTPEYIKLLKQKTREFKIKPMIQKNHTLISSYTHAVEFGKNPILIGERINPTGKKRFKEALLNEDYDYILKEGINQQQKGADVLDVNVGLPEVDEAKMLSQSVIRLQEISDLPLQIDTADYLAMEKAMRLYNGKPLVNSVNGKEESMQKIFPLVKKYGGVVVALTLDETGIPETVSGRVEIAQRIYKRAQDYGISKKDIIIDPLAMAISSDTKSALITLDTLETIKKQHGVNTSLGISNISFGLPQREYITSTFFAMALSKGLSAAIMNPYSAEMMKVYHSFLALTDRDSNCEKYIDFAQNTEIKEVISDTKSSNNINTDINTLSGAVKKGMKELSAKLTKDLLKTVAPMRIINDEIIPALDSVGRGFEEKTVFLPQLLMSAEAAKASFEIIKDSLIKTGEKENKKLTFVIATVKGDIHDIGKNIVKVLLENYDYRVIDLGKDVAPETIAEKIIEEKAPLCGLSALMTTTVPAMEETIKLIKERAPWCKIAVGGAVLTEDYAKMIDADKYCADAMETVRYAERVNEEFEKEKYK